MITLRHTCPDAITLATHSAISTLCHNIPFLSHHRGLFNLIVCLIHYAGCSPVRVHNYLSSVPRHTDWEPLAERLEMPKHKTLLPKYLPWVSPSPGTGCQWVISSRTPLAFSCTRRYFREGQLWLYGSRLRRAAILFLFQSVECLWGRGGRIYCYEHSWYEIDSSLVV